MIYSDDEIKGILDNLITDVIHFKTDEFYITCKHCGGNRTLMEGGNKIDHASCCSYLKALKIINS